MFETGTNLGFKYNVNLNESDILILRENQFSHVTCTLILFVGRYSCQSPWSFNGTLFDLYLTLEPIYRYKYKSLISSD